MLVYAMRPPCARHVTMVKVNHRQDKCPIICISHTTHAKNTQKRYGTRAETLYDIVSSFIHTRWLDETVRRDG